MSGRNQLVGRIDVVQISGLMAEVRISIGVQQITSIITARSAREMQLKPGQIAGALVKATDVMILRIESRFSKAIAESYPGCTKSSVYTQIPRNRDFAIV